MHRELLRPYYISWLIGGWDKNLILARQLDVIRPTISLSYAWIRLFFSNYEDAGECRDSITWRRMEVAREPGPSSSSFDASYQQQRDIAFPRHSSMVKRGCFYGPLFMATT